MVNFIFPKRNKFRENESMMKNSLNKLKIELLTLLLVCFLVNSISYTDDIQNVWKKAYDKIMKGEHENAWKEYEELLVKKPKDYNVVLGAGCIKYYQAEKNINIQQLDNVRNLIQEAEHYFDSAIQLAKTSEKKANSLYNKGNCNLLIADAQKENPQMLQECINYYRNAIRIYREAIDN